MQNESIENSIDLEKLQERMGNCFIYLVFILGDGEDKYRSTAIRTHGEEYMRVLWNTNLSLNQKYHIAMMAKISCFTVRGAATGFLHDRWEDMSADSRLKIMTDVQKRIRDFKKTANDIEQAQNLGFFEREILRREGLSR